jgi:NAD(P)-dependent dehydrogenase (short-subunit alcohol dehydrogenase family)
MTANRTGDEPTVLELFDLHGRVAIVTGAGGHLGAAMAQSMAEAGARVIVTSRDSQRADTVARGLRHNATREHLGLVLDQTDPDSIDRCIAAALDRTERIDVLVNNAHEPTGSDWQSTTAEDFQRHFANVTGYFLLARHVRNQAVAAKPS